jgi:hypothetical protein
MWFLRSLKDFMYFDPKTQCYDRKYAQIHRFCNIFPADLLLFIRKSNTEIKHTQDIFDIVKPMSWLIETEPILFNSF